ncbi:MAG: nucleoside triphosphate pyrophosphatase [Pseudomonadota bacterium]
MHPIVLASASPARRSLLGRLGLDFKIDPADVDESATPGESAEALAHRLAQDKAHCVAERQPANTIIIGSDQVAVLKDQVLGKPGSRRKAIDQLTQSRGQTVVFYTAWCVLAGQREHHGMDITKVRFRDLSDSEISAYVDFETPFGCAGSFKAESRGIALFQSIQSTDPTGLIGLPLIGVCEALRASGVDI